VVRQSPSRPEPDVRVAEECFATIEPTHHFSVVTRQLDIQVSTGSVELIVSRARRAFVSVRANPLIHHRHLALP
jgi:hypothetical protein